MRLFLERRRPPQSWTRRHILGAFAVGRLIAAGIAALAKPQLGWLILKDERSKSIVTLSLFRVAGLTGTVTFIVLSLLPGSERPHTGLLRQIEHVIAHWPTAVFSNWGTRGPERVSWSIYFSLSSRRRWSWRGTGFLAVILSSSILSRARLASATRKVSQYGSKSVSA